MSWRLLVMITFYHECYRADKRHFQSERREGGDFCGFPVAFQLLVPCPSMASAEMLSFASLRNIYIFILSTSLVTLAAKQFPWKLGSIETVHPHLNHAWEIATTSQILCLYFWLLIKSLPLRLSSASARHSGVQISFSPNTPPSSEISMLTFSSPDFHNYPYSHLATTQWSELILRFLVDSSRNFFWVFLRDNMT